MSNQYKYLLLPVLSMLLPCGGTTSAQADTFRASNSFLLDPCGQSLVIRGANVGVAFPWDPTANSVGQLAQSGANAARMTFRWRFTQSDPQAVAVALEKSTVNHMLAIPSIWDASGEWDRLAFAVDFWAHPEMVSVLRQYEDMTILNIGNEVGNDTVTDEDYRLSYQQAVKQLRDAGLHMPLLIDAAGYGRNESYILNNARYLIANDTDRNLLFGWHPWDPGQPQSRYKNTIDLAKKNRIPLLLSEFAHVGAQGEGSVDYRYIMQYTAQRNIGWLWWWWSSGATPDVHALTADGTLGNWANVGEEVVSTSPYGISATSQRTGYLQNRSCLVPSNSAPPLAPSNLAATATQGAEVVLTWKDNSNNEKNFDIEVWDQAQQRWRLVKVVAANSATATIGAGAEYIYTMKDSARDLSLNYATTYQIRVGAYRSKNAIAYSAPVSVTTGPDPRSCANGDGLLGEYFTDDGSWEMVRIDPQVNFNWVNGSPDPSDSTAPTDDFTAVWQGEIEPQFDGEYTFYTNGDDYARVLIDGNIVVDNWRPYAIGWAVGKANLQAGVRYPIQVEYKENKWAAQISLYWAHTKLKRELVPQCRLFAPAPW